MFTGLVEDIGTIVAIANRQGGRLLTLRTRLPLREVGLGDSIAVDGACLTVETVGTDTFTATAGRETLEVTTLHGAKVGDRVHLERALAVSGRLDGHLVQGHVDGIGTVTRSQAAGESWVVWVQLPDDLLRYVAAKGSVCVSGVSLTVNELADKSLRINVVPHTAGKTRLASLVAGEKVNIEVDVLAKYVERLLSAAQPTSRGLTMKALMENGFV